MDTIQLNKLYTLDNHSVIEIIKKTAKFITYRCGYLQDADTNYDDYSRNRIYKMYGNKDMEVKAKLFVEDEGNNIYIKECGRPRYFKTDKPFKSYHIFDDNKIIERKIIYIK
jgi:hypothetical protein